MIGTNRLNLFSARERPMQNYDISSQLCKLELRRKVRGTEKPGSRCHMTVIGHGNDDTP